MMQESRRKTLQLAMRLLSHLLLIYLQLIKSTESANLSLPGCPDSCGGVSIPYPFGIGTNCSMSHHFNVTCKQTDTSTSTPQLYEDSEILNINLSLGQVRRKIIPKRKCYNATAIENDSEEADLQCYYNWSSTPYWINNEKNKFTVFGCNTLAYLRYNLSNNYWDENVMNDSTYTVGCLSTCLDKHSLNKYGKSCSGVGCCQTAVPLGTNAFSVKFDERYDNSKVYNISRCGYAMLIEDDPGAALDISNYITPDEPHNVPRMPTVFNWAIGNMTCKDAKNNKTSYACKSIHSECSNVNTSTGVAYLCNCKSGYDGNPYLLGGCQDIDECNSAVNQTNTCAKPAKCHNLPGTYMCSCPSGWRKLDDRTCQHKFGPHIGSIVGICGGIVAILILSFVVYVVIERRKFSQIKEKYFQQHGGWILLETIKSNQGFGFTIFTKQQIDQATNNFDGTNIIGHGGQGIVYRGTLKDQTVAIKKCKIVDENKRKEFGKEMLILSQISHKNIVKLLGCCLEVEVPILIYEFISKGTLFQYIHNKKSRSPLSLTMRLRIAHESAEALAYLHTSASPPIFHGDVKSSNILLDQNYIAKISDFGASILAPTNEEQFVTFVQGTCGYLDPEYLQSCQLKDKSDVYSFGVVLVELLTSKPVIDFDLPEEQTSLSSRFISAMKENKLQGLLDNEINNEDDMESIREVAELAMKCLNMRGEERPAMKEVAEELYRIIRFTQHTWEQEYHPEETTTSLSVGSRPDTEIEHSSYYFNVDTEAQESIAIGR